MRLSKFTSSLQRYFIRRVLLFVLWILTFPVGTLQSAQSNSTDIKETQSSFQEISANKNPCREAQSPSSSFELSVWRSISQAADDEDFDGDDQGPPTACLEVCFLLVPTVRFEFTSIETKVGSAQPGTAPILFERPPPSSI